MDIQDINGGSRVLGAEQGYIPLPVRDVWMHDETAGTLVPAMQTSWLPTKAELARLNAGHPVLMTVLGTRHPPVMLDVEEPVWPIIDAEFEVLS